MEVDSLKMANSVQASTNKQQAQAPAEAREGNNTTKNKNIAKANDNPAKVVLDKSGKAVESKEEFLDPEYIGKVLADANRKIFPMGREFNYSIHEGTNRIIVKVMDINTKEVIKEIPPEKTLNALAKMWELAGLIIDEKL